MEKTKELLMPQIGTYIRNVGRLVKVETIPPIPVEPQTDYIFEDIEARCELRLNGESLRHIETLCDYYGLGTGVKSAIEEMKDYAQKRHITPTSDVEVVVVKVTQLIRKRPTNRESFYDRTYRDFQSLERGSTWNLPEPTEEIVWSSKDARKDNSQS